MSSLITTVVVVIVLVIVLGGGILTLALGWNTFIPRLIPSRWRTNKSKEQQQLWPSEKYPYPPRGSVETDWANSPIESPANSPVASPRGSRQSSDLMAKHASMKEVV
ncbi:hypothetical protein PFICI_03410 [Pestalotiopsis fici W106-1]|uniref:Uncharacterized protein n=1 Tax=Pestalotiopsis fici (strain W106-1 / CGMCC3.15140) TaxID=1229662 RepID=W3XH74_PESFW|nr:uncharacterized protein PFICI_03410 [Pestalotiopsis fici W106-1]ETS85385.1 hypothetical protein PFICI_03410 [Pestalotiopsis fici W106-1]